MSVRKKNIKTQKVGELTEFLERAKEIRKQWSPDDHAELRGDRLPFGDLYSYRLTP